MRYLHFWEEHNLAIIFEFFPYFLQIAAFEFLSILFFF